MELLSKMGDYEVPIPRPVCRFVEYKLYHYKELKTLIKEWEVLKEDLLHQSKQVDAALPPPAELPQGSSTERTAMQRLLLETKAQREAFWVRAIEDVLGILPAEDRRLVELKYFDGYLTMAGVARELSMSERTAYDRREKIIRRFAERFGLI